MFYKMLIVECDVHNSYSLIYSDTHKKKIGEHSRAIKCTLSFPLCKKFDILCV